MTGEHSGALGLGPRADQVEKLARDLLAEQFGSCRSCGGPRSLAVLLDGPLDPKRPGGGRDPRSVLRCEDCGLRADYVTEPDE